MRKKDFTKYETDVIEALTIPTTKGLEKDHPARKHYPLEKGWLFQADLNKLTKATPHTKIPGVLKQLQDRGAIEVDKALYENKRKEKKSLLARRLKKNKETLLLVWRCFSQNLKTLKFIRNDYYTNNPHTRQLVIKFNRVLGFPYDASMIQDEKKFEDYWSPGELNLIAVPELFDLFLESPEKLERTLKRMYQAFPNKEEALLFLITCSEFNRFTEKLWDEEEENVFRSMFEKSYDYFRRYMAVKRGEEILKKKKSEGVKPNSQDAPSGSRASWVQLSN